jgi:hypothetical protein
MLDSAIRYHSEGLCVIPVKPRDKAVALPAWEEYQTRCSTLAEIKAWWASCPHSNIGIVSGVNNFVTIDIDHDSGAYILMRAKFPALFAGRIEQSGSGQGYHVPMFLSELPDLGYDNSKARPKGNRTWHTKQGDVNIRARWCQAVVPPSIHPSGGVYRFIQEGDIVRTPDLAAVIEWLNQIDPSARIVATRRPQTTAHESSTLAIKSYFPSVLAAFAQLGYTDKTEPAQGGETRITGHGGLIVDADDQRWYCFSDETGGDVVDAFGWARFGARWNRYDKGQFFAVMRDMEQRAGIGETRALPRVGIGGRQSSSVWGPRLKSSYWGKAA